MWAKKYATIVLLTIMTALVLSAAALDSNHFRLNNQTDQLEPIPGYVESTNDLACDNCDPCVVLNEVRLIDGTFFERDCGEGCKEIDKITDESQVHSTGAYDIEHKAVAEFQVVNRCDHWVSVYAVNDVLKDGSDLAPHQNYTLSSYKGPGETMTINVEDNHLVKQIVFMIPKHDVYEGDVWKRDPFTGELKLTNP